MSIIFLESSESYKKSSSLSEQHLHGCCSTVALVVTKLYCKLTLFQINMSNQFRCNYITTLADSGGNVEEKSLFFGLGKFPVGKIVLEYLLSFSRCDKGFTSL